MNPGSRLCCLYIPDVCLQDRLRGEASEPPEPEGEAPKATGPGAPGAHPRPSAEGAASPSAQASAASGVSAQASVSAHPAAEAARGDGAPGVQGPVALLFPPRAQAPSSRVKVVALNEAARRAGVAVGMSLAQAELACDTLLCWDRSQEAAEAIGRRILEALWRRFPAVEMAEEGIFYIGTRGLAYLYQGEAAILAALEACAQSLGFAGRAGAASNRFTALTLARWALASPPTWAPSAPTGREARILAPLPISLLPAKPAFFEKIRPLGLRTLGQLAALKRPSIERRFGAEGVRLHRLASGEDDNHLSPALPPQHWQRRLELDDPVAQAEGIAFLLSPLLTDLFAELRSEGRACASLSLALELDDGQAVHIPLETGAPTEDPRMPLELLRLKLAKTPLPAGVVALEIEVRRATEPSHGQQHLFQRQSSAVALATTLERLRLALGEENVVQGQLKESWLPGDAYTLEGATVDALEGKARGRRRDPPPEGPGEIPLAGLRHFAPPRPIVIQGDGSGRPESVALGRTTRRVLYAYGPFCLSGGWWAGGHRRAYYRLLLSNHSEILAFHEHLEGGTQNGWFLEGVYD